MNTKLLAQFTIPGNDQEQVPLSPPPGLSPVIRDGGETAGRALSQTAFDWIFYIAIILAVLYLMWSGIQWMTSGGSVEQLQAAKRRMAYAIIGLLVVVFSFVIVRVVLNTIGGDSNQFFSPFAGLNQPSPSP